VRNWARVQIGVLSLLCKNFFALRTNFSRASAQSATESEQTLSFFNEV
jgi:hypothetical protein